MTLSNTNTKPFMQPNFADDIPRTDWSHVSTCCDGGRCPSPVIGKEIATGEALRKAIAAAAVQSTASSVKVEVGPIGSMSITDEPSIEHCEAVAARLVAAQREWNALRKKPHDAVKQPSHYTYSQVEPIVAIDAWQLSYNLGCVVKYIVRAKHKGNELLDLEKAAEYLRREIEFRTARLNAEEPRR